MTTSTDAGLLVLALGTALRLWALKALKRAGLTTYQILRVVKPMTYTEEGPYRALAHPSYIGSLAMIAGLGMIAFGWGGFILALPAWPFFKSRMVEEDHLRCVR